MRLLIITQKVNLHDDVLGFFHYWLEEFSKQFDSIVVICLESGEYHLPDNVKVCSLGKERRPSAQGLNKFFNRLSYLFRFYFFCFKWRRDYDAVFVHMNHNYVIWGWWLWRLLGKKIGLWYAHGAVPVSLKITENLADIIFTSTPTGFNLPSQKLKIVGQGIDTERFKPVSDSRIETFVIITVGRIAPVKHQEILLAVARNLQSKKLAFKIKVAGLPILEKDKEYFANLKKQTIEQGLAPVIDFVGSIDHDQIVPFYQQADLFVNFSDTGSFDKAILEAMSCGLFVLSSNEAVKRELGERCYVAKDPAMIADKIVALSRSARPSDLRPYVIANHSLTNLITKISKIYDRSFSYDN